MSTLRMPSPLEMGQSYAARTARRQVSTNCQRTARQLSRYSRLLKLPAVIQREIDARRLPMFWAEKLFRLPQAEIDAVAAAIVAGADATAAAQKALAAAPRARPQRAVPSDRQTVRRDLLTLASAVLSDSFFTFVTQVEARNADGEAAESLHRARAVAQDIYKRPGHYAKHAQ